ALRPAQHLDPGKVDQVELGLARPRVVDAVEIEADAVFEPVHGQRGIGAEAADGDAGVARVGIHHLQGGDLVLDLAQREIAGLFQRFGAYHTQRDWDILRHLLAVARGYHNGDT